MSQNHKIGSPETITVTGEVTAEDIAKADTERSSQPSITRCCPLYQAVARITGRADVAFGYNCYELGDDTYEAEALEGGPEEVARRVALWDARMGMEPFAFRFAAPA